MTDWAAIVAEHGPRVWRTAFRVLNRHADAHDCYQEAFLAALKIAPADPADWGRILTCLATRKAIDRLRARVRSDRTGSLDAAPEPAAADDPAEPLHLAELVDRLRAAVAELPKKQAEVVWLSCMEELTHQEIADQLRISTGEVRVLLHRGRQRLRKQLAPDPTDARRPS
ncbi:MAG: RNA polymerase sigma factor [Planctomycetia bacterium]